MAKTLHC